MTKYTGCKGRTQVLWRFYWIDIRWISCIRRRSNTRRKLHV